MEPEDVRALTEQALRTGMMLSALVGDLLGELSEDAFEGEDQVEVLFEMIVGTIAPVAAAAGAGEVRAATALLGAMSDRVLADLYEALRLAEEDSQLIADARAAATRRSAALRELAPWRPRPRDPLAAPS